MNDSPFQKKTFLRDNVKEISYLDFSFHAMDDKHFYRIEAYGETRASAGWIRQKFPSNWEEFSLEYIYEGECTYEDGAIRRVLRTGDLFIFKDNAVNQLYCDKGQNMVKYYLILRYNKMIEQIYNLSLDNFQSVSFSNPERILMLYNDIRKMVINGHKYLYSELSGKIYQLFFELKNAQKIYEFEDEFSGILSSINFSPERFPDLKSIQKEFKISRYALMLLFHNKLHTTPIEYVNRLKFGKAAWLLENQITPVKVIAQTCGFHSVQYFITGFRKRYKMTPLQYRRSHHKTGQ